MLRGLLRACALVVAGGSLFTAGCHPQRVESPRPQPSPVAPLPDAVARVYAAGDCSCHSGPAGAIASALCRVYAINGRASASFDLTFRTSVSDGSATTVHGTVTYAPSDGTVRVYYHRAAPSTRRLPSERELATTFSFLGAPLCKGHAIRELNPMSFSYEGGSLVEVVSGDRRVLYYIRRDAGTVHALSAKWADGTKARFWFGDWSLEGSRMDR